MADEFILFSQSIVSTIKGMCRSGLSSAHGCRISLTGSLCVNIDHVSDFVIHFNETVPADCISFPANDSDCEEVVDLTEDGFSANTQVNEMLFF
jgi:hypothetical protein